MKEMLNYT